MDELIALVERAEFWHWWALALVLIVLEVTMLGAFFLLWVGIAAAAVGLSLLIVPELGWQMQLIIWGGLSVLAIAGWHRYREMRPVETDQPLLNQRGAQYIGRIFTLEEDIVNGQGKIKVDDSIWSVQSTEDFKAGTKIKVIALSGTVLDVEAVAD